jgi:hypothetical protein
MMMLTQRCYNLLMMMLTQRCYNLLAVRVDWTLDKQ